MTELLNSVLFTLDCGAFTSEKCVSSPTDESSIETLIKNTEFEFGVGRDILQVFELVPIDIGSQKPHRPTSGRSLAVGIQSDKTTLSFFKHTMAENKHLRQKVDMSGEAVITLTKQLELHQDSIDKKQGSQQSAAERADTEATKPLKARLQFLEEQNRELLTQLDDIRRKLSRTEDFKVEVLQTVKSLKKELAVLTEDIMLTDWEDGTGGDNDGDEDTAPLVRSGGGDRGPNSMPTIPGVRINNIPSNGAAGSHRSGADDLDSIN